MIKQIFTFGYAQKYQHHYVVIEGKDRNDCRSKMFAIFGKKWAFQYDTEEQAGIEKWKVKKLELKNLPEYRNYLDGLHR